MQWDWFLFTIFLFWKIRFFQEIFKYVSNQQPFGINVPETVSLLGIGSFLPLQKVEKPNCLGLFFGFMRVYEHNCKKLFLRPLTFAGSNIVSL